MITRYAFIFFSPEADPSRDGVAIETGGSRNWIFPVSDLSSAPAVAAQAAAAGAQLIELCGAFDNTVAAAVQAVVGAGVPVGVVRYPPDAVRSLASIM